MRRVGVSGVNSKEANAIGDIVNSLGSSTFGKAMDAFLREGLSFDMSCIFTYRFDQEPLLIHDGYSATVSRQALRAYIKRGYLLDPFYVACVGGHPSGVWRMNELAPDSFFSSDFVISRDVHPCISSQAGSLVEEIGFIVPLETGLSATYSLMRNQESEAFNKSELEHLKVIEPMINQMISTHWRLAKPANFQNGEDNQPESESAFLAVFGEKLTPTQSVIAALILRGHSNISLANSLGITEGTAKLHRSNIYKRLGIASQTELFQMFINYLSD